MYCSNVAQFYACDELYDYQELACLFFIIVKLETYLVCLSQKTIPTKFTFWINGILFLLGKLVIKDKVGKIKFCNIYNI